MSKIYVHPNQVYMTMMGLVKKHKTAIIRAHADFGPKAVEKLKKWTSQIKPFAPVDTGRFKDGWKYSMVYNGIVIYNDAPYAGAIEHGVGPGKIPSPFRAGSAKPRPFRRIVQWAERKLATGELRHFRSDRTGRKTSSAYGIAIKVQSKLHSRGLKPRKVMTHHARQRELIRVMVECIHQKLAAITRG